MAIPDITSSSSGLEGYSELAWPAHETIRMAHTYFYQSLCHSRSKIEETDVAYTPIAIQALVLRSHRALPRCLVGAGSGVALFFSKVGSYLATYAADQRIASSV